MLPQDSLPAAAEVFAGLPEPLPDDESLLESIRAMRATDGVLLGVVDDDPTGSQAVHDVQVVTVLEEDAYEAALASATATCFVLTNSRRTARGAPQGVPHVAAAPSARDLAARRDYHRPPLPNKPRKL